MFRHEKKTQTWEEALEFCRKTGGDLASILNQEEQDAFKEVELPGNIWIGLRRSDPTHLWAWSSGELQTHSEGTEGQNCAVLNRTHTHSWRPENCSHTHTHFLCYWGENGSLSLTHTHTHFLCYRVELNTEM